MRNFIDERCAQLAKEMVPDTDAIIDEIRPLRIVKRRYRGRSEPLADE